MQTYEKIEFDFETFHARDYLKEYYSTIDFENDQLLRFFSSCYSDIDPCSTLLEFGSGPTLYSLITAATKVRTIYVCDKLAANMHEIDLWKRGAAKAFNWEPFIQRALEIEGKSSYITSAAIQQRTKLLRKKLTPFGSCDAFSNPPLSKSHDHRKYDIVQVNFVPESITSSYSQWEIAIQNILSLLKVGGTLLMTTLKNATYYHLQQKKFPAVNIDEDILIRTLTKFGFKESQMTMQTIAANPPYRGYGGMIFMKAQAPTHMYERGYIHESQVVGRS